LGGFRGGASTTPTRAEWPLGKTMLAKARGTAPLASGTPRSGAAVHKAMKGQSLPQAGMETLPGQQGISSDAASASPSVVAVCAPIDIGPLEGIPIVARATGANNRPTTASNARRRYMVDRSFTSCRISQRHFCCTLPAQFLRTRTSNNRHAAGVRVPAGAPTPQQWTSQQQPTCPLFPHRQR
jgi:hypothetical protein